MPAVSKSAAEFFAENMNIAGFGNPYKALYTSIRELVENGLDAAEEIGVLPEIKVRLRKLSKEELKHISNLQDYFPNCQILIIKIGDLPQKQMIVTHDEKRPDMEIELHEIKTWEAVSKLEEISLYPYWDRAFDKDEKSHFWSVTNYKELIESQLNSSKELFRKRFGNSDDFKIKARRYLKEIGLM